jgi:hypothetical protein
MSDDPFSRDSIFISWGKFRVGAVGRFAIVVLGFIFLAFLIGRSRGWL